MRTSRSERFAWTGGAAEIELEVSCANDAALHLYLSCGFDVMGTEDYYAVSSGRPSKP
jgi:ribosomal protein S18 acetylase RimI-like enzyme